MGAKGYRKIVFFIAAVVGVQVLAHVLGKEYYLTQLTMSAYYLLVILGLCMLMGYAGQISLGHAGFFAIGGYISAFLTTYNLLPYRGTVIVSALSRMGVIVSREDLYGETILHVHPWVALVAAVALAVVIAYAIGKPVLKLKGHYLAMATLGFGIIVYRVVLGSAIFGEADGLSDVPPLNILPGVHVSGDIADKVGNYYIAWFLVILCLLSLLNLVNSRVGRALRSIHGDEDAANAMGVDTSKYKLNIFVLSAAYAAIGGVFLTHYNGGIGPSEASVIKSIRYVAIVAVGGMANLWGALSMGAVLDFLSLRGFFGSYDDAFFGGILIVIMLFAPEGILGREILSLFRKTPVEGEGGELT
jgi:branched-chain amino acid transport system permease protein